ncbi:anhydro-N-acetylmuramic acid kinase [Actinophytocola oryzae]|uniref:Anhydro-N-acetylmuramic acid kinase n=1 Tax=Actinophytocola oryzae TaxID=502181 RepID=A0A4R7UUV1_9PSEU|nr:anhydro-N-acetylmuramic acid kinase [Actinophytocola oryzae]TDV39787.1 anhydro-N-acetylmuramic acid kinase [Actinophytocola oryzae]
MDGVDVAVADLALNGDVIELVPVGHVELPYPAGLRAALLDVLPPRTTTAEQMCRLDTAVGQAFAAAAGHALATIADGRADLVASLGQTVYHWVDGDRALGTLQLGQPAWLAEATGLPVVSDLRARDITAGGHGAPLAIVLDRLWLSDQPGITAALNLGGIANITVVEPGRPAVAYDTGPGNALLDAAARLISNGVWQQDVDGDLAAQGSVDQELLEVLLADPYYTLEPPKSTGKEHFNHEHLAAAMAEVGHVAGDDLLATLVELTAVTVARACHAHGVTSVIASGGGTRNPTLMAALKQRLAPASLMTSDELGLPAGAKEAYLTALLGFLTWAGVPATTRLLGSVTPGAGPLRLPAPATTEVNRLRVVTERGGSRASA